MQQKKPHLIISLSDKAEASETILYWIDQNNIRVLNIGGPSTSSTK